MTIWDRTYEVTKMCIYDLWNCNTPMLNVKERLL